MRCRCTTRWFFRCVGFLRRPCKRDFTILLFDTYIYAYIYYMHISPRAEADMAMKEEGSEHQEEAKPIPPHPTSGEHQTRELIMPQPPRRRPPRGPEAHDLAPTLAAGVADPQDHSEVGSWSWGNVVGATVPVSCGGGALDPSPRFLLSRPGPLGVSTASVLPSMYCTFFTASTADNPIGQSPPFHSISLPPPLSLYIYHALVPHPRVLCATSVHLVYLAPGHLPLTILTTDTHYTTASAHTFRLPRGLLLPPPLHAPFSQFSAPF